MNSGYNIPFIESILGEAKNIQRTLEYTNIQPIKNDAEYLRPVILSGTTYANEFKRFAQRMNSLLTDMKIQIVVSTGPSLSRACYLIIRTRLKAMSSQ